MNNTPTIDWKKLHFAYLKTDYNVRCYYKDGQWGSLEVSDSEFLNLHIAATGLHYGQEAFEGLKVHRGKDGKVRLFRWEENAKRLVRSAQGLVMQEFPINLFGSAVHKVVQLNQRFIPPYETGASLYLRPLLYGSGARIGVGPASEYQFILFTTPVGPYFKEGFKLVDMMIAREFDRAAPLGTGSIKAGGNYGASLLAIETAHHKGFSSVLFLDAKEKKFIDECGPANFFGIKGNTYVTPKSSSILPSITNMSLMDLARDMGLKVEARPIPLEELSSFDEVGACGTAAIISPIGKIVDESANKVYSFCADGKPGPVSVKLYNRLRAIQYGDEPDKFGWVSVVEL